MTEQESSLDALSQIRNEFTLRRVEGLGKGGFGAWMAESEVQIREGLIPEISEHEGLLVAGRFTEASVDLKGHMPVRPEGSTKEKAFFEAVDENLVRTFGDDVLVRIEGLVEDKLVPLRRKKGGNAAVEEPRYKGVSRKEALYSATRGLMNGVWVVAREFQLSDEELSRLHPNKTPLEMRLASLDSLRMLLVAQVLKGQAQANGFMARSMHEEQIWFLGGGVRGIPPGGAAVIGEFLDSLLASRVSTLRAGV